MALLLDGIDDFVSYGDINALDGVAALTIDCWVNWQSVNGDNKGIVVKVGGSSPYLTTFAFYMNNPGIIEFLTDYGLGHRGSSPSNTLVANTWTHTAAVYDGSGAENADRVKIYKDGVLQTLSFTGTMPATLGNTSEIVQCGKIDQGPSFSNFSIENLRIWTAVFPNNKIVQSMNSRRPIQTADLKLWAPFDDAVEARDYSGSGNHGTVSGAVNAAGPPIAFGAAVLVL